MQDNTEEEVGISLCKFHRYIQEHPEGWEHKLDVATRIMRSWLLHPLNRNWNLIKDLDNLTTKKE
jgi:hypothetical protein